MVDIKEYEASALWKAKSKKLLENKELVCQICGRSRWKYQPRKKKWKRMIRFAVHHIRYTNVPDEKPEDLLIICGQEHELCHTILRLRHMGPLMRKLAEIVEQFFPYDGSKEYMKGVFDDTEQRQGV